VGVGTPAYLIVKQASDVGLFPATPMLVSYDMPARPEFWKNLGDKGTFTTFIAYYHPTMKLTPRGEAFRTRYRAEFKEEPVYGALTSLGDDLRFVFITSQARVQPGTELSVEVAQADAQKCERCWHWRADVGNDARHPALCARCVANLLGSGEPRQFA